jgi:hypothetical protein
MQVTKLPFEHTKYLVLGDNGIRFPFLRDFPTTANPQHAYEAVILVSPVNEPDLYGSLLQGSAPLCPVINLSGVHVAREDYFNASPSRSALEDGLSAVEPIMRRLCDVGDLPSPPDRAAFLALALAFTRDKPIEARLDPRFHEMVCYPLLEGIRDQRTVLGELARADLLQPRFFDRTHVCERCGSGRLIVREECPECRSSHLVEESLVHHYRCGHQGPQHAFQQGARLNCPKCHRELRHYGVDYDKPGNVQHCAGCGHVTSEPAVGFRCGDCGAHQDADAADAIDWYHYGLMPAAIDAVRSGILPHHSLESVMSRTFGAAPVRDFVATTAALRRVSHRYERPLTGVRMRIANVEGLKGRRVGLVFSRLGEIVSQILRETDLITATNEAIYAVLPETDHETAVFATKRIRTGVQRGIPDPLDLQLDVFPEEAIDELLSELE